MDNVATNEDNAATNEDNVTTNEDNVAPDVFSRQIQIFFLSYYDKNKCKDGYLWKLKKN